MKKLLQLFSSADEMAAAHVRPVAAEGRNGGAPAAVAVVVPLTVAVVVPPSVLVPSSSALLLLPTVPLGVN